MLSRATARSLRRPPWIQSRSDQLIRSSQWLCQSCSGAGRRISSSSRVIQDRKSSTRDPSPGRVPKPRSISSSIDAIVPPIFDPILALGSFGRAKQAVSQDVNPVYTRDSSGHLVIAPSRLGILDSKTKFSHTVTELLQTINACASVGKSDRAIEIIRRMLEMPNLTMGDVQEANATFIRAFTHYCRKTKSKDAMGRLQTWFELDMRIMGLTPCSTSIALLCRAAFLVDNVKARSRTLRRYLAKAEELQILGDAMSSPELEPKEFEELCRVREDLFALRHEPEAGDEQVDLAAKNEVPMDDMTIRATDQEGLGLATLLSSIRSLEKLPGLPKGISEKKLRDRQLKLETHVYESEAKRWEAEHTNLIKVGINPAISSKSMLATLWEWKTHIEADIKQHVSQLQEQESSSSNTALSLVYFEALPADKMASIAIMHVLSTFSKFTESASVSSLVNNIGNQLADEHFADRNMMNDGHASRWKIRSKRRALLNKLSASNKKSISGAVEGQMGDLSEVRADMSLEWPHQAKATVAGFLITKLLEHAKLPIPIPGSNPKNPDTELEPALTHSIVFERGKQRGMITPHPGLSQKLAGKQTFLLDSYLPMIAPPQPWEKSRGAYFTKGASLMRMTDRYGLQNMYLEAALSNGDVDQVLKALNILSTTPWVVHTELLKVIVEIWNSGQGVAGFPPSDPQLEYPEKPTEETPGSKKREYFLRVRQLNNLKSGYMSNRCFINMQLELARVFRNIPIYFPYNIDFRGRAYPVPSTLNHMGADHVRALCIFEKGKPLGEHGIFWLKVHCANKFGANKSSLEDRVKFVDEHLTEVVDSAKNPLNGNKWWMEGEDPWQTLAACMEIAGAMEFSDPREFVSRLPIQQDGSCNGLQHYAALGGDALGAAQVNLVPSDRPADIYTRIADLVRVEVDKDAKAGNEMAKKLQGHIKRKIVKRPVMTNVYGVTNYGVIRQVLQELDEVFPVEDVRNNNNFKLATYVSRKIFQAFGNLFAGATKIQDWLADCASIIATSLSQEQVEALSVEGNAAALAKPVKSKGKKANNKTTNFQGAVVWTTPLGLPIAQPYRSLLTKSVKTTTQSISIQQPNPSLSVSRRKQRSAFPPNFVHSLDATHMMMTAVECDAAGLTFASVHDSFWTHASDVPVMADILRDQFVKMHSEDVIGRLAEEFKTRYAGSFKLVDVPKKSQFFKKLQAWRTKNKPTRDTSGLGEKIKSVERRRLFELRLESERVRLLRSEDSEERERGEEMVTPGSMYLSLGHGHPDLKIDPVEAEAEAKADAEAEASATESAEKSVKAKKKTKSPGAQIWLPIEFPPLPQRGELDISVVKDSPYFFS
jgi:DNA-directed RNA polymerase